MANLMHDGYSTMWKDNETEEILWCYIGMGEESNLFLYNTIKTNMDDPENDWTQFEISFDKNGVLREFHYLVFTNEGNDCDLIGREMINNGIIIGHTLLSSKEFQQVRDKAKVKFDEEYDEIDWENY